MANANQSQVDGAAETAAKDELPRPWEIPGQRRTASVAAAMGWLFGLLLFAGVVAIVLHVGDLETLTATLRQAEPSWIAAAIFLQLLTYLSAAAVWWYVLRRTGTRLRLSSLLSLAVVQLYANQVVPTGGVSGSVIVVRGLVSRGVTTSVAMTALLVSGFSYYAAYLVIGLSAFMFFWVSGDLTGPWRLLLIAFVLALLALVGLIAFVADAGGRWVPARLRDWHRLAALREPLAEVPRDILRDWRIVPVTMVLQASIFLLDAATLWCTGKAVGLTIQPAQVFASFVLASVVATLSPVPLGLGSFDGTCTGMLHFFGAGLEGSLAATLILRGFTLWLPMVPGMWLIRREGQRSESAARERKVRPSKKELGSRTPIIR